MALFFIKLTLTFLALCFSGLCILAFNHSRPNNYDYMIIAVNKLLVACAIISFVCLIWSF